jgi:ureidoglycolate lyase
MSDDTPGLNKEKAVMVYIVDVPVEPLTHESFAQYGQIIGPWPGKPTRVRPRLTSWRMALEMDGRPDMKCIHYAYQEREFTTIERHLSLTESRIPMGGGQAIMVVAASPRPLDRESLPEPKDLRAFLLDGTAGIMLWRGTWHSLDCYPVRPPYTAFAFISEKECEAELEAAGDNLSIAKRTQVIDFAGKGVRFKITDPKGVLSTQAPVSLP